jgi:hypothetical protein
MATLLRIGSCLSSPSLACTSLRARTLTRVNLSSGLPYFWACHNASIRKLGLSTEARPRPGLIRVRVERSQFEREDGTTFEFVHDEEPHIFPSTISEGCAPLALGHRFAMETTRPNKPLVEIEVVRKLGWGGSASVWLVRLSRPDKIRAAEAERYASCCSPFACSYSHLPSCLQTHRTSQVLCDEGVDGASFRRNRTRNIQGSRDSSQTRPPRQITFWIPLLSVYAAPSGDRQRKWSPLCIVRSCLRHNT